MSWEGARSRGLERAHGICKQVLVSTLLHLFICSLRVEKNEGGGSLRIETNVWLPLGDHWKSGGDKFSLIQGGFREEVSTLVAVQRQSPQNVRS